MTLFREERVFEKTKIGNKKQFYVHSDIEKIQAKRVILKRIFF